MDNKLLFVTSFNDAMFEASGRNLMERFLQTQTSGELLVCREGNFQFPSQPRIKYHNLDVDGYLLNWLMDNREVIPDYLGGTAKECKCRDRHLTHGQHRDNPGCHWQWMNRNASRWFRKVASLRYAASLKSPPRWLVWIDSDAYLVRDLPAKVVRDTLNGKGLAYCKGHRPAVESGVMFFDLRAAGLLVISLLCRRYDTGRYRRDAYWDDGYQLARVMDDNPMFGVDLVHPTKYRGKTNDVIPTTSLARYFVHRKGTHWREGVMK